MPTPYILDIYHGDTIHSFADIRNSGILGVIHKASQGSTITDSMYEDRRAWATAKSLLWGAYHFGTNDPVPDQVSNFLDVARPDSSTLLALDYEPAKPGHTMTISQCIEFIYEVEDRTGRKPVLYSGSLIKETISGYESHFTNVRLWLAQYSNTWSVPKPWTSPWLWQYTGDGHGPLPHRIPGAAGDLDLNTFSDPHNFQWA